MSDQRKKDLAKESKKHGSVGKNDKQGRLLSWKFKEERVSVLRVPGATEKSINYGWQSTTGS